MRSRFRKEVQYRSVVLGLKPFLPINVSNGSPSRLAVS